MVYSASFDITLDPGDTGLTLKSQIFDTVGAQVGADRTTGFVEAGGGLYTQVITDIPDGQRGSVRFLDGATLKAHVSLNPEELENTDVKTSTRSDFDETVNDVNVGLLNANTVTASALAADAVNEIRDGILSDSTSFAGADIASIKTKTDNLPVSPARAVAIANFAFVMWDSTDHVTAKTGLTVTPQISKDGGAFAAMSNAVVEIGSGVYKISITAGEMTADDIVLIFTATGADDRVLYLRTDT